MKIQSIFPLSGALAVAVAAFGQPVPQPPSPVFGEQVEVASVDVLVLDSKGNPAPG